MVTKISMVTFHGMPKAIFLNCSRISIFHDNYSVMYQLLSVVFKLNKISYSFIKDDFSRF